MLHELPSFHFKSTLTFSSMLHIHQGSHHFPGWPSGLPRVHQNRVVPGDSLHGKPLGSAFHLLTYTLTHGSFGKKKIMDSNPHPPKKKCLCLKKKKSGDLRTRAGALSARWSCSLITACCVAQLNTISQKALKIQYPFSQTVCLSIPSHPPALNQPTTELLWTATDFPCSAAKQNHTVSYFKWPQFFNYITRVSWHCWAERYQKMGSSRNSMEPLKWTSTDPITSALSCSVPITSK